ncbi:LLM class flavin-dependent oxidoreductase [Amycolatopsis sp. NPDC004378]
MTPGIRSETGKLGLQIPGLTWPNGASALVADLAAVVRTADQAGFDSIAVMDHFFQIGGVGPVENDMLEAYTTLGFIAAHTERAKLLTVVLYRHPGLLTKAITTLDVLSGGRAILGVGAGRNEEEPKGLGFPFPSVSDRFELLEENFQYVLQMWTEGDSQFKSKHFDAERLLNVPQALSDPRPPIVIGGSGEKAPRAAGRAGAAVRARHPRRARHGAARPPPGGAREVRHRHHPGRGEDRMSLPASAGQRSRSASAG